MRTPPLSAIAIAAIDFSLLLPLLPYALSLTLRLILFRHWLSPPLLPPRH
jgi:hypothetical protein